jgi:ubiquinone/menaquinone biosynthesis C-methylase UbiE
MWHSDVNDAVIDLVAPGPGERVVDIGAGMGPATVGAASLGASVIAVEPTRFMRAILRLRRLAQRSRSRITVVDGAAEQIPVADGSVDALWATNTMHHWTDPDRAVSEIRRALGPGGRLLLVDEDFDDPSHPDHHRFGSRHGHQDHGFHKVDARQMGERLSSAGLVDVDTSLTQLAGRPVTAVSATAQRPSP